MHEVGVAPASCRLHASRRNLEADTADNDRGSAASDLSCRALRPPDVFGAGPLRGNIHSRQNAMPRVLKARTLIVGAHQDPPIDLDDLQALAEGDARPVGNERSDAQTVSPRAEYRPQPGPARFAHDAVVARFLSPVANLPRQTESRQSSGH